MKLETKRLILRPWEETDAKECYKYAKDPDVGLPAGWRPHESVEYSRTIIKSVLSKPETYAIVLKKTGRPIGSIALRFHSDLAEEDDECELGCWLGKPYWGRGIMPEAAAELIRHAFLDLKLRRIWYGYYDGNERSKRVQEKCGFEYVRTTDNVAVPDLGEIRKGHVNILTEEDWQIKRIKRFEETFDLITGRVDALDKALQDYKNIKPRIKELTEYYEGGLWRADFEDDEKGRLPKDLKRGVLSEDGVYDLLDNIKELEKRMKK